MAPDQLPLHMLVQVALPTEAQQQVEQQVLPLYTFELWLVVAQGVFAAGAHSDYGKRLCALDTCLITQSLAPVVENSRTSRCVCRHADAAQDGQHAGAADTA